MMHFEHETDRGLALAREWARGGVAATWRRRRRLASSCQRADTGSDDLPSAVVWICDSASRSQKGY